MNQTLSVTMNELRWLVKAIAPSSHRPILGLGCLSWLDGRAALATTDTHRLHIVYLDECPQFDNIILDLKWMLHQASYYADAGCVWMDFDSEGNGIFRVNDRGSVSTLGECYGPIIRKDVGVYPTIKNVIPFDAPPMADMAALNPAFLHEALWLASQSKGQTESAVIVRGKGNSRPIVFEPNTNTPRWLAVVMPMTLAKVWTVEGGSK